MPCACIRHDGRGGRAMGLGEGRRSTTSQRNDNKLLEKCTIKNVVKNVVSKKLPAQRHPGKGVWVVHRFGANLNYFMHS